MVNYCHMDWKLVNNSQLILSIVKAFFHWEMGFCTKLSSDTIKSCSFQNRFQLSFPAKALLGKTTKLN